MLVWFDVIVLNPTKTSGYAVLAFDLTESIFEVAARCRKGVPVCPSPAYQDKEKVT